MIIIVKMWDSAASFVAVILLLEEHGNSLSGGQFDLISGGCVTDLLAPEHEARGRVSMMVRTPWPQLRGSGGLPGRMWSVREGLIAERSN